MQADGERFDLAISFLGTGQYKEVTYFWDGRECRTQYFPVAVCQFFAPTELRVLATDLAQQKHGEQLKRALDEAGGGARCTFVPVPECRTEPEMWELFDVLTQQLGALAGKRIVLDVTHGYRSLPVLSLIAAAYLRVAAGIEITKLVYGAFDASQDDRKPVFDLTPFLALLEWTSATEQFVRAGNAEPIAALLREAQNTWYRSKRGAENAPTHLKPAADQVQALSQSLQLLRPRHTWESARRLDAALRGAEPEIDEAAKPFGVLLEKVRAEAQRFVPDDTADQVGTHLEVQQKMLDWYLEHERYVHAGLLMRELVVSLVTARAGLDVFNRHEREWVEEQINARSRRQRKEPAAEERPPASRRPIDVAESILELWDPLTQLRNDLAHAKDERPPASVIAKVRELAPKVQALAQPEQLHGGIQ